MVKNMKIKEQLTNSDYNISMWNLVFRTDTVKSIQEEKKLQESRRRWDAYMITGKKTEKKQQRLCGDCE